MTTYYVEPGIGNDSNAGTSWGAGNSWATLQKALNTVAAGDTVYCKQPASGNAEELTAVLDIDGTTGTGASPITLIGVNSAGVEDGTQYVIDWGTTADNGMEFSSAGGLSNYNFRNFKFASNGTNGLLGLDFGTTQQNLDCSFINCWWYGWATGSFVDYMRRFAFVKCKWSGCTSRGIDLDGTYSESNFFLHCTVEDNATGIQVDDSDCVFDGCLIRNNTLHGVAASQYFKMSHCVIDGNGADGVQCNSNTPSLLSNCRFTNNTNYGLQNLDADDAIYVSGCYFDAAGDGAIDGNYTELLPNELAGTDTDDGYENSASGDYNLAADATLRNVEVTLP